MKLQKHHFTGKLAGCFIFFLPERNIQANLKYHKHHIKMTAFNSETFSLTLFSNALILHPLLESQRLPKCVGDCASQLYFLLSSPCPLFWPRASLRITPHVSFYPHLGACADSSQSQFLSVFHSKYHLENTTSSTKHPLTSCFLFSFFAVNAFEI